MIDRLVQEINTALDNGCYLVALSSALTLPDICGKAEYPDESSRSRYKKWYSEHIGQFEKPPTDEENIKDFGCDMPYPSANVVYDLRNSLLHSGNPNLEEEKKNITSFRLIITKDYSIGGMSSLGKGTRELDIAIRNLCFKLCDVARRFYHENKEKFHFDYSIIEWDI